jgi:hypothetical protein
MWWAAFWMLVTVGGAAGSLASVNSVRFARRVSEEARRLRGSGPHSRAAAKSTAATLPTPVQRYLARALAGRSTPIRHVRLRHAGSFKTSLDGAWLPILALDPTAPW